MEDETLLVLVRTSFFCVQVFFVMACFTYNYNNSRITEENNINLTCNEKIKKRNSEKERKSNLKKTVGEREEIYLKFKNRGYIGRDPKPSRRRGLWRPWEPYIHVLES